jgi:hypothetical protein
MLRVAGVKADPGKLTAKLARLDHQRTLLSCQLAVWTEKQQVTKKRLDVLDKQMAQIGRLIRDLVVPSRKGNQRKQTRTLGPEPQPDNGASTARHRDMGLEY